MTHKITRQKLGGNSEGERYAFARSLGCPLAERTCKEWSVRSTVQHSSVEMEEAYHTFRGKGGRDEGICSHPGAAIRKGYKVNYHRAVRITWVRCVSWIDRDGRAWMVCHNHLYRLPRGNWTHDDEMLALDGERMGAIRLARLAEKRGEVYPFLAALLPDNTRLVRDMVARRSVSPRRLLAVRDVHLRGWIAERCGGLAKVASKLRLVERTKEGELRCGERIGLTTDILVVRDSTSGERFALGVPRRGGKQRTVRNALRALNRIPQTKIVAQS